MSFQDNMVMSSLPLTEKRTKSESKVVGKAGQAFNVPNDQDGNHTGFIMGNLILPPKGIKDAESVGQCSQAFTVCWCQPGALEIAFGHPDDSAGTFNTKMAHRFLVGPGDMFRIPPGNTYRLENHSKSKDCYLTWLIIRPHE